MNLANQLLPKRQNLFQVAVDYVQQSISVIVQNFFLFLLNPALWKGDCIVIKYFFHFQLWSLAQLIVPLFHTNGKIHYNFARLLCYNYNILLRQPFIETTFGSPRQDRLTRSFIGFLEGIVDQILI